MSSLELLQLAGPCGAPAVCSRFVGRIFSGDIGLKSWAVSRPWSAVLQPDGSYTPRIILFWWKPM